MTGEIYHLPHPSLILINMKYPDFSHEIPLWEKGYTVIGVDEVGRGCLAGPVYVAACCIKRREDMDNYSTVAKKIQKWGIQDSKKISPKNRIHLQDKMRVEEQLLRSNALFTAEEKKMILEKLDELSREYSRLLGERSEIDKSS